MSKIRKISVTNLKAVGELEMNFEGMTAIITGKNDSGKTTFLRSIPDRIRGLKPSIIVKEGQKNGKGTMELTTGEKFEWEFDVEGKDKLVFITKDGYPTKVTKEISNRFFPPVFDIDKFVNDQPKDQRVTLQKLVGIDFSIIDEEYKEAYTARTVANRLHETEKTKLAGFGQVPEKVEPVNTVDLINQKEAVREKLNEQYKKNKAANETLRKDFDALKERFRKEFEEFNEQQDKNEARIQRAYDSLTVLNGLGYSGSEVDNWIASLPKPQPKKSIGDMTTKEPEYIPELPDDAELKSIDKTIADALQINMTARAYTDYMKQKEAVELSEKKSFDADVKVKSIEQKKKEMVTKAKFPSGIELTDTGILVDGYPLDKTQISTSKFYCAALRLASLNVGEVKTLYFDASPLDNNTLAEIEAWAQDNLFQLLIEVPSREGGDIKYEIIQTL